MHFCGVKAVFLKILTGLVTLWPIVTVIVLAIDAFQIHNAGLDWSGWLGITKFFPVVFPVILMLTTFIPMVLSIYKRKVSTKEYSNWKWAVVFLAPLALPIFWYRFIWKENDE
ncbi:MAG: hypothetical protein AB8F95_18140 [Bacteroidia bacterium]